MLLKCWVTYMCQEYLPAAIFPSSQLILWKQTNTHKQIKAWSTLLFPNYPSILMNSIYIFQSEIIFRVTSILFIYKSKKAMYYFTQFFRNIFWSTLCIYSKSFWKDQKSKLYSSCLTMLFSVYMQVYSWYLLCYSCAVIQIMPAINFWKGLRKPPGFLTLILSL